MSRRFIVASPVAAAVATPAAAHSGGHAHLSAWELLRHHAEPGHLALLALAAMVGWLALRWGKRIERRVRVVRIERERGRP